MIFASVVIYSVLSGWVTWRVITWVLTARALRRDLTQIVVKPALGTPKFNQGPPPVPEAWTPLEREALGINDTLALIARIDAELTPTTWTDDEGYVYKIRSPGFGGASAGSMPPC